MQRCTQKRIRQRNYGGSVLMEILYFILTILGLAAMGNYIAERATPIQLLKKKLKLEDVELLNCPTCLTFHLSWIYFLTTAFISPEAKLIIDHILISAFISFIAHYMWLIWNKI